MQSYATLWEGFLVRVGELCYCVESDCAQSSVEAVAMELSQNNISKFGLLLYSPLREHSVLCTGMHGILRQGRRFSLSMVNPRLLAREQHGPLCRMQKS